MPFRSMNAPQFANLVNQMPHRSLQAVENLGEGAGRLIGMAFTGGAAKAAQAAQLAEAKRKADEVAEENVDMVEEEQKRTPGGKYFVNMPGKY